MSMDLEYGSWRIRVVDDFTMDDFALFARFEMADGRRAVLNSVELTETVPHQLFPGDAPRCIPQTRDFIQKLIDAAWEVGIRPTGHDDVREAMKQQSSHLQDMRKIVGKKIGVEFE